MAQAPGDRALAPQPKRRLGRQSFAVGSGSGSEVPTLVVEHDEMAAPTVDLVLLNVYDLGDKHMEHWKRTGMQYSPYHSAVEVYGYEFSWSMPADDLDLPPDVTENAPRQNLEHKFRSTVSLGYTAVSPRDTLSILADMKREWSQHTYRIHGQNCHSFCEAVCGRLGVPTGLPDWVKNAQSAARGRVVVRVYDLGQTIITRGYNAIAHSYGAFHSGVEVYGKEWSFGMTPDTVSTGISWNPPGECENHSFREMISMGWTRYSEEQVMAIIEELHVEWKGNSYDLLTKNCHHFSEAFCARLGVTACMPAWVNKLASSIAGSDTAAPDGAAAGE
mmetsp:Transcript_10479/g.27560  ORF Transcript_10479/g.27560 Transcript_10479/m.27560 type:complete len:332 (-) Transcript_10479:7-1002(-)